MAMGKPFLAIEFDEMHSESNHRSVGHILAIHEGTKAAMTVTLQDHRQLRGGLHVMEAERGAGAAVDTVAFLGSRAKDSISVLVGLDNRGTSRSKQTGLKQVRHGGD